MSEGTSWTSNKPLSTRTEIKAIQLDGLIPRLNRLRLNCLDLRAQQVPLEARLRARKSYAGVKETSNEFASSMPQPRHSVAKANRLFRLVFALVNPVMACTILAKLRETADFADTSAII